jgi:hypothetical protein
VCVREMQFYFLGAASHCHILTRHTCRSDPAPIEGWCASQRGAGYLFGRPIAEEFARMNGLNLIARSHQLVKDGFFWDFQDLLVTVWSAPNCECSVSVSVSVALSLCRCPSWICVPRTCMFRCVVPFCAPLSAPPTHKTRLLPLREHGFVPAPHAGRWKALPEVRCGAERSAGSYDRVL